MQEPMKVISLFDESLDRDRMLDGEYGYVEDVKTYVRDRDISKITPFLKPGAKPTRYVLRPIPNSVMSRYVLGAATDEQRYERAFRAALTSVEDSSGMWEPTGEMQTPAGPISFVSDAELDRWPMAVILEIGSVAWSASFLPRVSGGRFALPPLSADAVTHIIVHCAAQSRSAVDQNNGARSGTSAETASPTGEPGPASDEDIAAPATAGATG